VIRKEIKIGDKIISMERASSLIDKIFDLRSSGQTQEEVAKMLGVERSFISHLEGIGEVRKSKEIALIGSGLADVKNVEDTASKLGIEHVFLNQDGTARIEDALQVLALLRTIDFIIFLGPSKEHKLLETVLDKKIIGIPPEKEKTLDKALAAFTDKRTRRAFRMIRRGETGEPKRSGQRKYRLLKPESRS
jgi:transcriptional regulator with XRE-family HTH domain